MNARSVQLNGFTLSVQLIGSEDPDAPLVAMVHGMMESSAVWRTICRALPPHFRYALLDMPWSGQTAGQWGWVRQPEAWLDCALVALHLQPDAFVAHSFGASVLLAYLATRAPVTAARQPAALISPFYKGSTGDFQWPLLRRYVAEFPQFVEESVALRSGSRKPDSELMARIVDASCETFGVYNWMEFWQLFARMPSLDLCTLAQPTLLISGADDFSSPPDDQHALANALPASRLELIPHARHFLPDSHGQEVTRALTSFLSVALSPVSTHPHLHSQPEHS